MAWRMSDSLMRHRLFQHKEELFEEISFPRDGFEMCFETQEPVLAFGRSGMHSYRVRCPSLTFHSSKTVAMTILPVNPLKTLRYNSERRGLVFLLQFAFVLPLKRVSGTRAFELMMATWQHRYTYGSMLSSRSSSSSLKSMTRYGYLACPCLIRGSSATYRIQGDVERRP